MDITFNGTSNPRSALEITSGTDESAPAGRAESIGSVNGREVFQSSSYEFPVIPRSATSTNSDAVSFGHRNVSGKAAMAFGALALCSFFMTALSAPTTRTTTLAASAPTFSSALSNAASSALSTVSPNQKIEILRKGLEQLQEGVAKLRVDLEAQGMASAPLSDVDELYSLSSSTDPVAVLALVCAGICLIIIILDKVYRR